MYSLHVFVYRHYISRYIPTSIDKYVYILDARHISIKLLLDCLRVYVLSRVFIVQFIIITIRLPFDDIAHMFVFTLLLLLLIIFPVLSKYVFVFRFI